MCLAVPGRITSIHGGTATTDMMGVEREVSLRLVPEAAIGDYILVHAGFGIQVIDERDGRVTSEGAGAALDFDAFRDPRAVRALIGRIHDIAGGREIRLMEVCGTHTMSIGRYGFRSVLPAGVHLLSGPGCPVCVTANRDIDRAVAIAREPGVTVATFGDMMRVPGSSSSLASEKADGADVRVVYSPLDALAIAEAEPAREVVFMGVGFETTAPAIAACILEAAERGVRNFSVLSLHKATDAALRAIAGDPECAVDGFLLPGHVSTIIGCEPYRFLPKEFHVPGVIAGFEPVDILEAVERLVAMVASGKSAIENAYGRWVPEDGNPAARSLMDRVFERADATWRGLGVLSASGFAIRDDFGELDAGRRFDVEVEPTVQPAACRCGDVLRGVIDPAGCPLFGRACTPASPVGPCMVSSEGSCAARWRYRS